MSDNQLSTVSLSSFLAKMTIIPYQKIRRSLGGHSTHSSTTILVASFFCVSPHISIPTSDQKSNHPYFSYVKRQPIPRNNPTGIRGFTTIIGNYSGPRHSKILASNLAIDPLVHTINSLPLNMPIGASFFFPPAESPFPLLSPFELSIGPLIMLWAESRPVC